MLRHCISLAAICPFSRSADGSVQQRNCCAAHCPIDCQLLCISQSMLCWPGPSDSSVSSANGRQEEAPLAALPHLDIFEPRPVLSGGLEAVLGQEAESLGSMSGKYTSIVAINAHALCRHCCLGTLAAAASHSLQNLCVCLFPCIIH